MNKSPHGEPAPFTPGQQRVPRGVAVSVTRPHMIATEHKIPSSMEERNLQLIRIWLLPDHLPGVIESHQAENPGGEI